MYWNCKCVNHAPHVSSKLEHISYSVKLGCWDYPAGAEWLARKLPESDRQIKMFSGTRTLAQLIHCIPNLIWTPGLIPQHHINRAWWYTSCEVESGGSEVQRHPQLYSELEAFNHNLSFNHNLYMTFLKICYIKVYRTWGFGCGVNANSLATVLSCTS